MVNGKLVTSFPSMAHYEMAKKDSEKKDKSK